MQEIEETSEDEDDLDYGLVDEDPILELDEE